MMVLLNLGAAGVMNGGDNQHMVDGILRNVEKLSSMLGIHELLNIFIRFVVKQQLLYGKRPKNCQNRVLGS